MEGFSSTSPVVNGCKEATFHLESAIETFDRIFIDVAAIDAYNATNVGEGTKISATSLTDKQCHTIKELSGHLISLRNIIVPKLTLSASAPPIVPHTAKSQSPAESEEKKKFSILKEYLINELNRSESAEAKLKVAEDELVLITAERDKLKKKLDSCNTSNNNCSSRTAGGSGGAVSGSSKAVKVKIESASNSKTNDLNLEAHVGTFVRKQFGHSFFFGLVSEFDGVYYQIVYEDADYEELNPNELRRVHWLGPCPHGKRQNCMKHAIHLGILTKDQCEAMNAGYCPSNGTCNLAPIQAPMPVQPPQEPVPSEEKRNSDAADGLQSAVQEVGASLAAATVSSASCSSNSHSPVPACDDSALSQEGSSGPKKSSTPAKLPGRFESLSPSSSSVKHVSSSFRVLSPVIASSVPSPSVASANASAGSSAGSAAGSAAATVSVSDAAVLPSSVNSSSSNEATAGESSPMQSKLFVLQELVRPAAALSIVTEASKVPQPGKSKLRKPPTAVVSQTSIPNPTTQNESINASTTGSRKATISADSSKVNGKTKSISSIAPHSLTALVQANKAKMVVPNIDAASDDSSVVFIMTQPSASAAKTSVPPGGRTEKRSGVKHGNGGDSSSGSGKSKNEVFDMIEDSSCEGQEARKQAPTGCINSNNNINKAQKRKTPTAATVPSNLKKNKPVPEHALLTQLKSK